MNYSDIKNELEEKDFILLSTEDEVKQNSKVCVSNGKYKVMLTKQQSLYKASAINKKWFSCDNKFIIENINEYFKIQKNGNFQCLSKAKDIETRDSEIIVQCLRCKTEIKTSLRKILRNDSQHRGITCSNCDGRTESLHALVLKQLFMHYYPDTELEEPSCINPETNCIMATDIVNHRLKIAIEVQGQWHRFNNQKKRDAIKKQFWLDKGYQFYDYEIDGATVLEYVKHFFPGLDEIPSWVNMEYSNKLNLIKIQQMLDDGMKVQAIANELKIEAHRIYDALQCENLHYPDSYIKSTRRPIVQLSMHKEYIAEFNSYADGARTNGIDQSGIISAVGNKTYYSNGYYWIPKDLYDSNNYIIPPNRLDKYYTKVNKIDKEGIVVKTFDDLFQAAKDVGTIASKIYEVAKGNKKTTKGFHYEFA